MNSNTTIAKAPEMHQEAGELQDFLDLHQKPRFPRTPAEWQHFGIVPEPVINHPIGTQAFDQIVNRKSRRPVIRTISRLFDKFKKEFVDASTAFDQVQWRLLFYLGQYPLVALADPRFDPREEFRRILNQDPWLNEVPVEWIGTSTPVAEIIAALNIRVSDLNVDQAKAVWAVLSLAKSLGLEKHEVLQVPFWWPWWLDGYFEAMRTDRQESRSVPIADEEPI